MIRLLRSLELHSNMFLQGCSEMCELRRILPPFTRGLAVIHALDSILRSSPLQEMMRIAKGPEFVK